MRNLTRILALGLVFLIGWEDLVYFEAIDMSITAIAGPLVIGFWGLTVLIEGRVRRLELFHLLFVIFILWNVASLMWTANPSMTQDRIQTYTQIFILCWLLWDVLDTRKSILIGLQLYVLGLSISVGSIVVNYISGNQAVFQRFSAGGFNTNDIAVMLVMGLPVAWYLALYQKSNRFTLTLQLYNLIFIPIALWAIVLTAARTALIGLIPVFGFMFLGFSRMSPIIRSVLIVASIIVVASLPSIFPEESLDRLATTATEIQSGSLNGRTVIWGEALKIAADSPILGVGSGAFEVANKLTGQPAHNVFLALAAELGLVGLYIFLSILVLIISVAYQQRDWNSVIFLLLIAIWFLGAITLNWEWKKITWILFTLVYAFSYGQGDESAVFNPSLSLEEIMPFEFFGDISSTTSRK